MNRSTSITMQELDYATNFLADGPGEWKDSGLGEAFRAAVANPDGINIIDWKPYGPSILLGNIHAQFQLKNLDVSLFKVMKWTMLGRSL